jgi:hypothetical protein
MDEVFENPILFENPVSEGGKIAIGVATVALIGAGLYFIFKPSTANAGVSGKESYTITIAANTAQTPTTTAAQQSALASTAQGLFNSSFPAGTYVVTSANTTATTMTVNVTGPAGSAAQVQNFATNNLGTYGTVQVSDNGPA